MGCGESKHQVATGNTITQCKKSKPDTQITKATETTHENAINLDRIANTNATVPQGETQILNNDSLVANAKENENGSMDSVDGYEKVKETENTGKETDNTPEIENVVSEAIVKEADEEVKEFKDEASIEGIISEGISGTSVYYSPNAKKDAVTEDESKKLDDVVAVEEKGAVDEETKPEAQNEEAVDCIEVNPVKAEEVAVEAVAAEEAANTAEEKVPSPNEEPVSETSA